MKKFFTVILAMGALLVNAQNVGIGTPTPLNKLHVAGGFRLDTLTGVNGAGLLRHDANGVVYGIKFSGNSTDVLRGDGTFGSGGAGSVGWLLTGNSGTNPATTFLGTTDNVPLNVRVNNLRSGLIDGTSGNTGWGYQTLFSNTTGSINTALGYQAMFSNLTGTKNVAVGDWALLLNTSGIRNTAVGSEALSRNIQGEENTAIGYFSLLQNTTGEENTAVGSGSLYNNTSGVANTATGYNALNLNQIGFYNSAFGANALKANRTNFNNAFGFQALYQNTTGTDNSAFGLNALFSNTTGYSNTALGNFSLLQNTNGQENTAVGHKAMEQMNSGGGNTAIGAMALQGNQEGIINTAVGYFAGNNSTGSGNTFIGSNTAQSGTLFYGTAIGQGAVVNAGGKIRLGYPGDVVSASSYIVESDGRFKENITATDVPGLSFINQLHPVAYNFNYKIFNEFLRKDIMQKSEQSVQTDREKRLINKINKREIGFVAQDIEKLVKEKGFAFNGLYTPQNENDNYGLDYSKFVVPLVKAVQEQQAIIEKQQKQIDDLLKRIVALEKK